jgi:hypothetical protein
MMFRVFPQVSGGGGGNVGGMPERGVVDTRWEHGCPKGFGGPGMTPDKSRKNQRNIKTFARGAGANGARIRNLCEICCRHQGSDRICPETFYILTLLVWRPEERAGFHMTRHWWCRTRAAEDGMHHKPSMIVTGRRLHKWSFDGVGAWRLKIQKNTK